MFHLSSISVLHGEFGVVQDRKVEIQIENEDNSGQLIWFQIFPFPFCSFQSKTAKNTPKS